MKTEPTTLKTFQFVSFKLANEEFGVDILKVREIVRFQKIARVPQVPDFVEGVINLRGSVIPIITLRGKFGLAEIERNGHTRIIVFVVNGKTMGVVVDRVEKVLRLPADQIELPPEIQSSTIQDYVTGVGKLGEGLILILDIDKVLSDAETLAFGDMENMKKALEDSVMEHPAVGKKSGEKKPRNV